MISKYKTMHILLTNVHLDCRGNVPVTEMLAGINLSKPGMNLSKLGLNLSKPAEKHNNRVLMLYIMRHSLTRKYKMAFSRFFYLIAKRENGVRYNEYILTTLHGTLIQG